MTVIVRFFSILAVVVLPCFARAQTPGRIDGEAAEHIAALIGAPVYAKDGPEVGKVADIAFDEDARPYRLRMTTDAVLGFGTRTLVIPKGAFMAVRGAVVLEVPAEAVAAFTEVAEPAEDK
jgi:sporulation protein YlmC with PRC-barrel domain